MLNREILNRLSNQSGRNLISLYMPTHRVGREIQQDPIRYKNLLSAVERRLEERGLRRPEIESLLERGYVLQENSDFWQHQSDGLALFISEKFLEYFRLPIKFDKLSVVAERFHLKPLLPLLSRNGYYYLLALSQKKVRLLRGSLFSIDEIDLEDVPSSLREALWFDDPERQLQFHTGTNAAGVPAGRPASFHGQGVIEDDAKKNLLRYFQKIDQGLMEMLADERAPLVLAGVDYLLPIYQEANNYPHLVESGIEGNPDDLDAQQLHQQAWKIVEPFFKAEQRQAVERFQELTGAGSELAASEIEQIIPAAYYGRVEILFTALGEQRWGDFDSDTGEITFHQELEKGSQDLLDLAAVKTLSNSGSVYALPPQDMPSEEPIAAVFRYGYQR